MLIVKVNRSVILSDYELNECNHITCVIRNCMLCVYICMIINYKL